MNDDLSKCYELLGVAPGVSAQELKAAYRDLAKVWHPDRFAHDPRLQQKAQERLKEINEAYDQLISGKTGRRRRAASSPDPAPKPQPARTRRSGWQLILLAALVSGVVFFAAFRTLISAGDERGQKPTPLVEQAQTESSVNSQPGNSLRNKRAEQQAQMEVKSGGGAPVVGEEMREVRALPTVTVMIDPASGMLARPDCPVKSRMTYPAGAEPQQYCNASHQAETAAQAEPAQAKQSRLKTFAKRLIAPVKVLGGRGGAGDRKDAKSSGSGDGQNR